MQGRRAAFEADRDGGYQEGVDERDRGGADGEKCGGDTGICEEGWGRRRCGRWVVGCTCWEDSEGESVEGIEVSQMCVASVFACC